MMQPKVYLAGPEVFLANVREIAERKKALCAAYGCVGIFPFDADLQEIDTLPPAAQARRISEANEGFMRESDCVIANATPFRGVSMDIGTGYEIGFMRGLGKPVFAYTNITATYRERSERYNAHLGDTSIDPYTAGTEIENFGLFENLMIDVALRNFDSEVVCSTVPAGTELTDLAGFEQCLAVARQVFDGLSGDEAARPD